MKATTTMPARLSSQDKAALTDRTAREIVEREAITRNRKTERLRALREARPPEAEAMVTPAPKKTAVKTAKTSKKSPSKS
jgi:hypothetical protein